MNAATKTTYAAIRETIYYGPRTEHRMLALGDRQEAEQAIRDAQPSGPRDLGHNVASQVERLAEVVTASIDPTDWSTWPGKVEDAAARLCADAGIDPEDSEAVEADGSDWLADAAQDLGLAVVQDAGGNPILVRPID